VSSADEAANQAVRETWEARTDTAPARAAAVTLAVWAPPLWGAGEAARWAAQAVGIDEKREQTHQSALLRCIFGNSFRPILLDVTWLHGHEGTVLKLARNIYKERAFDRLPVLADALEDAGCDNADILNHCRQPGEHAPGCWILDMLLNKQ